MIPRRLEARVARWGTRGGLLLGVTVALLGALLAIAWAGQAKLLAGAVETYAREEADTLARLLLYDLAADPRVGACRFHERRRAEMRRADPAIASAEGLSPGLLAHVRGRLHLPDAVVWDTAVRGGYAVRLSDVARARYLLYGRELERDREALAEELSARVTVSDHLRGARLRTLSGDLEVVAGETAAAPGRVEATFPLFLEGEHWADVTVWVDRSHLESVRGGLARSLGQLSLILAAALLAALVAWVLFWWAVVKNLRRTVAEPVAALAARMEAFEQEVPSGAPDGDEAAWLAEAFGRLVERVRASREQLRQAQRLGLMERIGAGLSHELNNALNPARLRVDEMLLDPAPPSREDLRTLKEHLLSAQRILKDLSLPGRRPDGPPQAVAPRDWLSPARRLTAPQFEGRAALEWAVGEEGPAVSGWPEALAEVAVNLLLNAGDAAALGPGPGRVWVSLEARGGRVELAVADDGPGLPEEVRGHLGEPFLSTKPGGTGLGLFVTDLLVRRMGGELALEDRPGGGTVARVWLKAAPGGIDGGA